jgi:hypothetical protein
MSSEFASQQSVSPLGVNSKTMPVEVGSQLIEGQRVEVLIIAAHDGKLEERIKEQVRAALSINRVQTRETKYQWAVYISMNHLLFTFIYPSYIHSLYTYSLSFLHFNAYKSLM